MSKFYFQLTICSCLLYLLIVLVGEFDRGYIGSNFVRPAYAQDSYAQENIDSKQSQLSKQQYDSSTNNPLLLYSTNQFEKPPINTANITSDKSLDDAPRPKQNLSNRQKNISSENITSQTKNNFRNNNKNLPPKNTNKKIRLAAVNSIDEDDRIIPAAPMPSDNASSNTNQKKRFNNIDNNNSDNINKNTDFDNSPSSPNYSNSSNSLSSSAPSSSSGVVNTNNVTNNRFAANTDLTSPNHDSTPEQPRDSTVSSNRQPVVDPYHPPIRTAAFNGVIPGHTSVKNVMELWGKPVQESIKAGELAHLYSLHELNHIEISYDKNKIVKSIVVRFDELFPENLVREQFESELLKSRPVLIPDETGRIIGELFPEKGVVFLFSSSKNGGMFQVRQIGIEPVISEPFVLRAEATLNDQPSESYRDLIDAIRINRADAKAYWLLARIDLQQGFTDTALLNIKKAIKYDERKPAYHLTLAQILSRMNRIEDAKLYLEETLAICERYQTDKARVYCLLGDFYRIGQNSDCDVAYKHHSTAIEIADQLSDHPNPTVRQTAKDILFESRLAVAKDIAWGRWKGKERAIENWLAGAKSIINDPEMIAAKRFSTEYPLKLAICELTCQVGLNEEKEIEPYVKEIIQIGDKLLSKINDPILLQKLQWEIGLAIYDAVQIYQLREKYELALNYGELAADYMELGIKGRTNESDLYLVGRLYFRLGTIHALGNKNHRAAIEWFNKAKPTFDKLFPKINPEESGRFGESLVSMGVSYWLTNQRTEAIRLTERGLKQIERGVKLGFVKESAFAIPYSNLMNMYNELGDPEKAKYYSNLSRSIK
ncbi:MAG: tetratricopeptide repeat protein [Planctomycetaceae bacterium]|jgi:tetratricopeptide (TPR) repeat protein|nr:tetratricopeptide repeat protein [Planctomycetaceae bacterium]